MKTPEKLHHLAGLGVFLAALLLYLKSMATTVSFWDCGEFLASSYILGIPHPPGAPLYTLLGRVFSMFPVGEVASRIVFMSALFSALAIWCVFQSTAILARRALGGLSLAPFGDRRDISVILGAALAALSLGGSYTFWFNAVEAEVYGYSIFFACLGVWLILYWEGTGHGRSNDRWLFLIAYVFGLGAGIHMLCLLTIPTILLLAWFADAQLRRLILLLGGMALWVVASMWLAAKGALSPGMNQGLIALGLVGLLYYLYRTDRRAAGLLLGSLLLFVLGYSTYTALYIRSGLNPAIDLNNPETWSGLRSYLNREQYGQESMLLNMLSAKASRVFQFWDLQMKYFFQQFPFPWLDKVVPFQKATDLSPDPVPISLIPYLIGLGGLLWHARRDWRRFLAFFAMFLIMGCGLSLYLNMSEGQPRERHYVFGGMFFAFALWMGLGWVGLVEFLRTRLRLSLTMGTALAGLGMALPAGIAIELYHREDRTDDFVAHDYGYNILQSCDRDSILFTNGDNDTYPLWYLQEVEGIRRDVRVVCLPLLNTGWYLKQLRDLEPKMALHWDDTFIDSVLTDTEDEDLYKRLWPKTQVPLDFKAKSLEVSLPARPENTLLRIQDIAVIRMIGWNAWERPIHFACTVTPEYRLGLDPYLQTVGMTLRLVPQRDADLDEAAMAHNLMEVYRFRGLKDPAVFKDEDTLRLMGNYYGCALQLANYYRQHHQGRKLGELCRWTEGQLPFTWEHYYRFGQLLGQTDQKAMGAEYTAKAGTLVLEEYAQDPDTTYNNALALAGMLVNDYTEFDQAVQLYRQVISKNPGRWDAYYELAATLQAKGEAKDALDLLRQYRTQHGQVEQLMQAEQALQRYLERAKNEAGHTL